MNTSTHFDIPPRNLIFGVAMALRPLVLTSS